MPRTSEPPEDNPAPTRSHLLGPVDIRSLSLALLTVMACVFALRAASAVFIPVLLGLAISYALSPLVDRLQRLSLPSAAASPGRPGP